jgi:G protein-coupled glucose receptor regulating Gpa2
MSITNATYTSPDWTGYKYPLSLAPLPDWMSRGLTVLCGLSFLSAVTSFALLFYITYLFIVGGARYRATVRKNQYVILIYSVLIADLQLATGFLVSIKWLHDDQMYAPSSACNAQAWLTNVGDLASGLFILAIAAHTFLAVVFGRRLEFYTFCSIVVGLWVVSVVVTAVPVILHPGDIFAVGGNWVTSSMSR